MCIKKNHQEPKEETTSTSSGHTKLRSAKSDSPAGVKRVPNSPRKGTRTQARIGTDEAQESGQPGEDEGDHL